MKDIEKTMKLSICFSLASAAVLPVLYEFYANIMQGIALALLTVWNVFVGLKFAKLELRSAMLSSAVHLFAAIALGPVFFVIIHPAIQSWLEKISTYIALSTGEFFRYWGEALLLLFLPFVISLIKSAVQKTFRDISEDSSEIANAINNAFSEEEK